jgi:predicted metal-dependent HD superfamily phosphohydrolase
MLKVHWFNLMDSLRVPQETGTKWFALISLHYGEPWRFYHTLNHISELLNYAEQFKAHLKQPDVVGLAIWFHE